MSNCRLCQLSNKSLIWEPSSLADPTINGFKGLLDRVEQLKSEMENVYVIDQFTNPANPDAHFRWTGNVISSK